MEELNRMLNKMKNNYDKGDIDCSSYYTDSGKYFIFVNYDDESDEIVLNLYNNDTYQIVSSVDSTKTNNDEDDWDIIESSTEWLLKQLI